MIFAFTSASSCCFADLLQVVWKHVFHFFPACISIPQKSPTSVWQIMLKHTNMIKQSNMCLLQALPTQCTYQDLLFTHNFCNSRLSSWLSSSKIARRTQGSQLQVDTDSHLPWHALMHLDIVPPSLAPTESPAIPSSKCSKIPSATDCIATLLLVTVAVSIRIPAPIASIAGCIIRLNWHGVHVTPAIDILFRSPGTWILARG